MVRTDGWLWKATGWCVTATSERDLMTLLGGIGVYSRGAQFAWRGMASADYHLSASLQRRLPNNASEETVAAAESAILDHARDWGLGMHEGRVLSDVQLLADLQHFGAPTRLVDFTINPMTALWFACQPVPDGSRNGRGTSLTAQGLLLAINRSQYKERSTERDRPAFTWGDLEGSSIDWTGSPQVIQASIPNARLRAQEGYFIAGTTNTGLRARMTPFRAFEVPFATGDPEHLRNQLTEAHRRPGKPRNVPFIAIKIPKQVKERMLQVLRASYNRTASVMFPDFDGFIRYGVDSALGQ
ncbi:FRG domain-containing protein [Microbacterium sp. BK668]|uniref:FRG domain-containing protein n=1 Tax=Microbacterium sp. BK668 TaxID=2512118 RepID=UPI00105C0019|nr:FRG domain-containing protein [Microbacterium sp. BK668]TDN87721.1 FRG domain-containing protein [Microbacterium sp. BK668]